MLLVAVLAALVAITGAQDSSTPTENNINFAFEFETGTEGWANSTFEEMGAEFYPRGGELVGEFRSTNPHFDSPLMTAYVTDKTFVVIRMKHHAAQLANVGSFFFRATDLDSPVLPPARFATGEAEWNLTDPDQWEVEFDIISDGQYHIYYVPLYTFKLTDPVIQDAITQLRCNPVKDAGMLQAVYIDYIRLMQAPTIIRVEGCSNLTALNGREEFVHSTIQWTRRLGSLDQNFDNSSDAVILRGLGTEATKRFAATYNCLREGGDRILISGHNFGLEGARVLVGDRPCHSVEHVVPQTAVACTIPDGVGESVNVTIAEGRMPGLRDTRPYLSYTVGPAPPPLLNFSNIGAKHLDMNWRVAFDLWDALTTTGYWIERRPAVDGPEEYVGLPYNDSAWTWADWEAPVVTTNVTTTTLIGLNASTRYQFRVAALSENVVFSSAWQDHDLYGRRPPVDGYILGDWIVSDVVATLGFDFAFHFFTANNSLDYGAADKRKADGMIGETLGEGHYGLVVIGDANVENCNQTHTCCDNFDPLDLSKCTLACSTVARLRPPYINNIAQRARQFYPIPTPDPDPLQLGVPGDPDWVQPADLPTPETLFPNGIRMGDPIALARAPTANCGPAFRLTPSMARRTGAVWYNRQQQVREGFDTTFVFRISNPSVRCTFMDDAYTRCRSRGGEGLAFVVHNDHAVAMGQPDAGMGFQGIRNGIAVEFDTWYNPELLDPWENHVALVTRGTRAPLSPNHTFELGHATTRVPDLTDGNITVRITYSPFFDVDTLYSPSFMPDAPYLADWIIDGEYNQGGFGTYGRGWGVLKVYLQNETRPSLSVPLNLDETLDLTHGRAYVGFTASTGEEIWQAHDLLKWQFTQLREDIVERRAEFPLFPDAEETGSGGGGVGVG